MNIGSLGDVVFETSSSRVLTLSGISMKRDSRFEDHDVQGEKPRSEFLAPGLAEFDLSIRLRASLGINPVDCSNDLNAYCDDGNVLRLIIAGWNCGKVTLRSVSEEWRHVMPRGFGVQSIDIKLGLKEYV